MEPCFEDTLNRLVDEYCLSTHKSTAVESVLRRNVLSLNDHMAGQGCTLLAALSEDIETWIEKSKWKDSTRRVYLDGLDAFFDHLIEEGLVEENPLDDVAKPAALDFTTAESYSDTELRLLLNTAKRRAEQRRGEVDLRTYATLCLAVRCCVGWTEMARLAAEDYIADTCPKMVEVGGRRRCRVILDEETCTALNRYLAVTEKRFPEDPLFLSVKEQGKKRVSAASLRDALAPVLKDSNLPDKTTFAGLRIAVARMLLKSAATPQEVSALLRNRNVAVIVQEAAHAERESIIETQVRLGRALSSQRTVAKATVRREELWEMLLNAESERVDVAILDNGSVRLDSLS